MVTKGFEKLAKEARALNSREKAALARTLIEDLDSGADEKAEEIWIEEAQRRYEAYRAGSLEAVPGEEAMQRARDRLR